MRKKSIGSEFGLYCIKMILFLVEKNMQNSVENCVKSLKRTPESKNIQFIIFFDHQESIQ